MNIQILNVINAVLDYKKWICSNNRLIGKESGTFDWYKDTEKYYKSLSLPDGMKKNNQDFEKVLAYSNYSDYLNNLNNTNYSDLHYHEFS